MESIAHSRNWVNSSRQFLNRKPTIAMKEFMMSLFIPIY